MELYRETGERRYLDAGRLLPRQRGHGWLGPSHRYNSLGVLPGPRARPRGLEVEGHAVRALYLTAGVADVYLETGEQALLDALERQWQDMVTRKLYLTGGVGSRHLAEAFGKPYELPNELAYCETCAAIASIMWCWRMLLITGEARFADLAERTLYNAVLVRRLAGRRAVLLRQPARGQRRAGAPPSRRPEPQAVAQRRLLPAERHAAVRVARALRRDARRGRAPDPPVRRGPDRQPTCWAAAAVALRMESEYPWDGRVRLSVEEGARRHVGAEPAHPGLERARPSVRVNGAAVDAAP